MNCFLLIGLSLLRGPPPLATTPPSLLSFPDENECQKDLHLEGEGGKGESLFSRGRRGPIQMPHVILASSSSKEDRRRMRRRRRRKRSKRRRRRRRRRRRKRSKRRRRKKKSWSGRGRPNRCCILYSTVQYTARFFRNMRHICSILLPSRPILATSAISLMVL